LIRQKTHVRPYPLQHGREHRAFQDSGRVVGDNHGCASPGDLLKIEFAHTVRDG
jgi:hypothetical protein